MSDDTWASLRHWGRMYRSSTFSARMFALRLREAVAEGATLTDMAHAAQVAPATARKYVGLFTESTGTGVTTPEGV